MSSIARKAALGKGLSALLGAPAVPTSPTAGLTDSRTKQVRYISVDRIVPNPRQPRHHFSKESLEDLANSIRQHGVLQPILVTPDKKPDHYILLAGERRFRASQVAELTEVPALISEATDEEMLEIAIVENVQREDLNPVEEAKAYRSLIDAFGWTQEQISQRVGKNRSTVANALRLLKLPDEALKDLECGRMTAGHARAVLAIEDPFYRQRLRLEIVENGISVREAESRALKYQSEGPPTGKKPKIDKKKNEPSLDTVALEERLMVYLGCRVTIRSRDARSGTVEIPFRNPDELQRFLDIIGLPSSD